MVLFIMHNFSLVVYHFKIVNTCLHYSSYAMVYRIHGIIFVIMGIK